uniref:Orotidine 5'-phosphate decarboxylase n=1 Tax=Lygus hesperus TaxID=30085 RepID=A0A0A9WZ63_LYGHE
MFWLSAFLVSCAFSGLQATPAEDLIDEMIYELNQEMVDKHQDMIQLPAIDETFEKKISFFKVRGEFKGDGGWFKNASSIKRTGPLDMQQGNSSMTIGISLGLEDMEFGFDKYSIEVFHIGVHGKLSASIAKNSIYGHLTMVFPDNAPCKTTLDKLEVQSLDDFHVDLTGLGRDADWIYSYVAQFLANKYHSKIANTVSEKLRDAAAKGLARRDICDKFQM